MRKTPTAPKIFRAGLLLLCLSSPAATVADTAGASVAGDSVAGDSVTGDLVQRILQHAPSGGGLIVHVNCGDGRLTAGLQAEGRYLVQGLASDDGTVQRSRETIADQGCYGRVSVNGLVGRRLPYADNHVNLLVISEPCAVPEQERLRVLCPGGKAVTIVETAGTPSLEVSLKPWPTDIDEWTHFLHDPSGNAVARDDVVGPPRSVQWIAGPRYTRSHEHTPSINAVVSTGGRIFFIADQAPVASIRATPRWQLVARDAFNGLLLWTQPVPSWFPEIVNWGQTPPQLQRKLVAVDDRVYVTLGLHAPLSALDSATGDVVKIYEDTHGTEEVICHNGILLLVIRSVTDERIAELAKWAELAQEDNSPLFSRDSAEPLVRRLRTIERTGERTLIALEADTGRVLWKKTGQEVAGLATSSLCALDTHVFYKSGPDVVCLDLHTGGRQWSTPGPTLRMASKEGVFCAGNKTLLALAPDTGAVRWTQPLSMQEVRDVFVANGALWIGGFKPFPEKRGPSWGPYFVTQRDLATGEMRMHVEPENPGHHHRCYPNKATNRYILGGRRGTEFIDLNSGEVLWHSWARGVCKYGVMPCNGLLYAPPHACACYVSAKLTGFYALSSQVDSTDAESAARIGDRLEPGPAMKTVRSTAKPGALAVDAWPTYRHDAERSGRSPSNVPAELRLRWQADVGDRISSPTIADGRVCVAAVEQHRVVSLDADSGQPQWTFTAGARVDSPPTLHDGRAIFGSRDGYVYSLRGSDGALAWRLQAARHDRRIVARGQLESAWPVPGSVLLKNGNAYAVAGQSTYLDGGMHLIQFKPATGEVLSATQLYSPDSETGRQPAQSAPSAMPGNREDILSADEDHIYLRDEVFDLRGTRLSEGNPHLLTLTGFLDDAWAHRSFWIFGTRCSISTGCSGRDRNIIAGRLMAFDETTVFGYGRASVHWSDQLEDGPYRVFAVRRDEGTTRWTRQVDIQVRALVLAGDVLFLAGPPADINYRHTVDAEPSRASLIALSAADGTELARQQIAAPPQFDGMAAAAGRLYIALDNGQLLCMEGRTET